MALISLLLSLFLMMAAVLLAGLLIFAVRYIRSRAWQEAAERTGLVYRGRWNGQGYLLGEYRGRKTGVHTYYFRGPALQFFAWRLLAGDPVSVDLDFQKALILAPESSQRTLKGLKWSQLDLSEGELGFSAAGLGSLVKFWSQADLLVGLVEWLAAIGDLVEEQAGAKQLAGLKIAAKKRRKRSPKTQKRLDEFLQALEALGFERSTRSSRLYSHPGMPAVRVRVLTRVIRLEQKMKSWELIDSFSIARQTAEALVRLEHLMALQLQEEHQRALIGSQAPEIDGS